MACRHLPCTGRSSLSIAAAISVKRAAWINDGTFSREFPEVVNPLTLLVNFVQIQDFFGVFR